MALNLSEGRYLSGTLGSAKLTPFAITETVYTPDMHLPPHAHERPCFVVVLEGSFSESSGQTARSCKPHTIIVRRPGAVHSNHFWNAGGRCLNIEMDPFWFTEAETAAGLPPQSIHYFGRRSPCLAYALYREYCEADDVSSLAIEGLLLQLLADAARQPRFVERSEPTWLLTVKDFVHSSFREPLTLSALGEVASVHPVYLATKFRKHCGCTIGEYVRRVRIEFARRALERSHLSLSKISAESGFYDQSHFTRTFKRLTGLTPGAYRETVGVKTVGSATHSPRIIA